MDKSDLYVPPKNWQQGVDAWYDQIEFIIRHTREQIAKDIEDKAKRYLTHWGELVSYEEGMKDGTWIDGSPINLSLDEFLVELVDVLNIVKGK